MSLSALGLVLAAALFHAIWNSAAKGAKGDGHVFVWAYALGSALWLIPIAIVLIALGLQPLSWVLLAAPVVGGVIHVVYGLVLQTGYRKAAMGVVYPTARGVGPLLTMIIALTFLGEKPGKFGVVGALVVLAGILVVATGAGVANRAGLRRGVFYGAMTGIAIASYTLWDDHSVTRLSLEPIAYFALSVTMQAIYLTPGALRRRAQWRESIRPNMTKIVIVAVLSPLAYILVLFAMQTTPVSIVAPVRESSIVIGSLLAWWLYKEANPVRRVIGAVIVLAGIGLIAAG